MSKQMRLRAGAENLFKYVTTELKGLGEGPRPKLFITFLTF